MGLEYIEAGTFCYLRQVSRLNLNNNKLQSPPELCALRCCLVTLLLSDNNLSNLRKNFFEGYKILETLHLSNNKLFVLPDLHWIKHSLKHIKAANNGIESLDVFQRSGIFESLSTIDMGVNRIRIFNIIILSQVPKLRVLGLYDNRLTNIDDFRIYYKNMMILGGNPWHCGTALSWMGEDDMAFENGLTCATPACLQGIAISDMSKYNKSAVSINRFRIEAKPKHELIYIKKTTRNIMAYIRFSDFMNIGTFIDIVVEIDHVLRQESWLYAPTRASGVACRSAQAM